MRDRALQEARTTNSRLCSDRSVVAFLFSFLSTAHSLVRDAMSATHHGDSQAPVCLHPTDLTQLRPFVEEARDIWYSKDPDVSSDSLEQASESTDAAGSELEHTGQP
jgi:hypothetical protein